MRLSMVLMGLAAVAAMACGGSDDGGGGGGMAGKGGTGTSGSGTAGQVDAGVPDGTPANELTDAQFDALCKSIGEAASSVIGPDAQKATCGFAAFFITTAAGLMGNEAAAACKAAYDECLAKPGETTNQGCTKPTASCSATVGEIETCLDDTINQAKELIASSPGCDDLGKAFEIPTESGSPPSCAVVQEKCPEALE